MKNQTILIVDDDFQNLRVLGNILRENKFNIVAATGGNKALELLNDTQPDLILLDAMMPEMDGFETCRKIKSDPSYQAIPVLFLSALNEVSEMVKGLECGALDYILKPFNASLLLSKIRIHLDLKSKTEELAALNRSLENKVIDRTIKLEKANRELTKLDEAKMEFLRIISHEIRTPLNGIVGLSGIIKKMNHEGELSHYIHHLDVSAKRLERFYLNALLFTHLNTGKHDLDMAELMPAKLVENVVKEYSKDLENKNIGVSLDIPKGITLFADTKLAEKCLGNILDNAIKYSLYNATIAISFIKQDDRIICRVADQGSGFSEKALQSLFQLFKPGETFVNENNGFELALCKAIMDAHHGDLRVYNQEKGAVVEMIFI